MNSGVSKSESKSKAARIAGRSRPMRDSGVVWIGEVPVGWELRRNKYIFTNDKKIVGDVWDKTQLLSLTTKGIKTKSTEDVGGKVPESYDTYQVVDFGDLVMCLFDLDCSAVFSGFSGYDGMISPAYKVFKVKSEADAKFYSYWFDFVFVDRKYKQYSKNVRYSLGVDEFGDLFSVLPPLLEQRAIAAYLDQECGKIDGLRAKIEQQIEKLGEYKKSLITEAVTGKKKVERKGGGGQWKVSSYSKLRDSGVAWIGEVPEGWKIERFGYHFSFSKGLNITKADLTDTGVPVISYGQIHSKTNDGVHLRDGMLRFVPREIANANQSARLCLGDIVFADTSEDVEGAGNCVLIDREFEVFAGYHDIVAKAKCPENSKYFAYLFQSSAWRSQVRANVNGIKVFSITQRVFKDVDLLLPPLSEQREIAAYLDEKCGAIDAMVEKCRGELEKLAEYKKSLIFECVTGKKEVA